MVLILAEFKLLLQNESIRPSRLQGPQPPLRHVPTTTTQLRGWIQHPWLCPGQGTSHWTMLELVYLLRLSGPSTNPSRSPRVCLLGCAAWEGQADIPPVGCGEVRRCIHGHFPKDPHLRWGGRAGPCWPTGGCCEWFVTSVKYRVPSLPRHGQAGSSAASPTGTCPGPTSHLRSPGEAGGRHSPALLPFGDEPSLGVSPAWG